MTDWILGLDASTPRSVLVLGRGEELVASDAAADPPNQTSARLLPRMRALVESAGIQPSAIGIIACGCGPGTFTGTRVAVATAKGIAVGLGVPALGVSTLAAMAFSADVDGLVLPLLDARRGEVYGGLFECHLDPPSVAARTEEACLPLSDLLRSCEGVATAVGTGVEPYRAELPELWRAQAKPLPGPTSVGFWRAIRATLPRDGTCEPSALAATYLRKSYAELGVNRPKRPFERSPFI